MKKSSRIYIAGHAGLAGSAIKRLLVQREYSNLIYKTHKELDLMDETQVAKLFKAEKPEYVFLAAAKVGGILANSTHPADFIYQNLKIQTNVIHNAYKFGVKKLLFLGSTCVYPKRSPQPIKEEYYMTGPVEDTNEAYAIAKIAGLTMCKSYNKQYGTNFISIMPTNLYGPNDNFDPDSSHVIAGLIQRTHNAKENNLPSFTIWGSGKPKREFLYVDDFANACIFLINRYNSSDIINVGCGYDVSIIELATLISKVIGYKGKIIKDSSKPDGMPRKLSDSTKLFNMGWKPRISLKEGIRKTYSWFLSETLTAKE